MRVENRTPWETMPMKKILNRLSCRLGRRTPDRVQVAICCPKGKWCQHRGSAQSSWVSKEKKVAYIWFPPLLNVDAKQFAILADEMMKESAGGVFLDLTPADLREAVQRQRVYGWADAFPMVRKPEKQKQPPRPRKTRVAIIEGAITRLHGREGQLRVDIHKLNTTLRRRKRSLEKLIETRNKLQRKLDRLTEQSHRPIV